MAESAALRRIRAKTELLCSKSGEAPVSTNPQILFTHISAMVERSPRLSLEDCSHLLRLSPRSVQQAVHAATGASFRALQERALLAEAERLTSYPPLSIKEIAIATGYKSARSFSRAVRRS